MVGDRTELTDREWALLAPLWPASGPFADRGPDLRRIVDGVLYRMRTGVRWSDLPPRFGPWRTVAACRRRWLADGTWAEVVRVLRDRLQAVGGDDAEVLRGLIGRLGEVARQPRPVVVGRG
nr:transposase [Embleya hyalina]